MNKKKLKLAQLLWGISIEKHRAVKGAEGKMIRRSWKKTSIESRCAFIAIAEFILETEEVEDLT